MRDAPLLQAPVRRGKSPGSPRSAARQRQMVLVGLSLLALAAAALLLWQRGGGGGGGSEADAGGDSSSSLDTAAHPQSVGVGGDTSSNPIAAAVEAAQRPADEQSLAAAEKRARKAAALPLPQHRSHGAGLMLSLGAAEAAAACAGERCELMVRFVLAAEEAARLADAGGNPATQCPEALAIGQRPLPYSSAAFGNRCEPLFNRGALEAVRQLLQPGWRGLEWQTGGSTGWLLGRIGHLTSIEGARGFAAKARAVAEAQFDPAWLAARWDLRLVPPGSATPPATFAELESAELWADYCAADFLPPDARFDVIAVQGFARLACLRRAVALLAPQGGLLVLPQAQRAAYRGADALVPPHWLRLTDTHDLGTTHVWMSRHAP